MTDTIAIQKNNFRMWALIAGLCVSLLLVLIPTSHVFAQSKEQICLGLNQGYNAGTNSCTGCPPPPAPQTNCADSNARITEVVSRALNLLSIVVGIAAVIMIIMAGFRYITAGGDSGRISSAQNSIVWAVVGIIVVSTAQVIVRFVLGRL